MARWISVGSSTLMLSASVLALASACPRRALAEAPAAAGSSQVEEIIVTAQKHAERSLTVPIAVSTVTARQLEAQGVADTSSIALVVPGLQLNRSLNSATPFIRGVGSPSGAAGEEGSDAIYVDGVYHTNQYANLFNFNNISSVEVLKGPQGTLFGRNAAGGAILVTTKSPSQTFEADATVGYANYDTSSGSLYVTGGLTDKLSANLAIDASDQRDPWGRSTAGAFPNGQDRFFSSRGKLLWEPTDTTRVTLAADFYRETNALQSRYLGVNAFGVAFPGFYNTAPDIYTHTDFTSYGLSLRAEHDFKYFTVASITAEEYGNTYTRTDFDLTPLTLQTGSPARIPDRSIQEDLQFLSRSGSKISWVAGFFYLHDNVDFAAHIQGLGTPGTKALGLNVNSRQITDSYAGYGQATLPILEGVWNNTHLTVGARYSVDDRSLVASQTVPAIPALNYAVTGHAEYPSSTWRVAVDHQFTRDIMTYVSFNTGFKSGEYNLNSPKDPPVRPEKIKATEVGAKARLLDGRLVLEGAGFYYDRQDIQVRKVVFGPTGQTTQLLNAASGREYGLDLSAQAAPTQNLTLTAAIELLDATYTSFPNAPISFPKPATCATGTTGAPTGGNLVCAGNGKGNDLIQSPPFTANLGATYTIPLSIGRILLNGAYSYNSGFFWEPDNRLKQSAFSNVNASATWRAPGDRWSVQIWGRNLTDTKRYATEASSAVGDQGAVYAPLTYGVTLGLKFGS